MVHTASGPYPPFFETTSSWRAPTSRTTPPWPLVDGPQWNKREGVAERDLLPVDVLRTVGWQRVDGSDARVAGVAAVVAWLYRGGRYHCAADAVDRGVRIGATGHRLRC